jgi:protein subunit release factor B
MFNVNPAKEADLLQRMHRLGVREQDLDEQFVKGSGKGGQKINKTSVCVQLLHKPSGIQVRCQRQRQQNINRFLARRMLCEKLESQQMGDRSPEARRIARLRKQKDRRARRRENNNG